MNHTDRYRALTAQRAYARRAARLGVPALLEPYLRRVESAPAVVAIPQQRRGGSLSERLASAQRERMGA